MTQNIRNLLLAVLLFGEGFFDRHCKYAIRPTLEHSIRT